AIHPYHPALLPSSRPPPHPHSLPTRRSSDLHHPRKRRLRPPPCERGRNHRRLPHRSRRRVRGILREAVRHRRRRTRRQTFRRARSEEHTSELQSPDHLVCRLLLEKKKI